MLDLQIGDGINGFSVLRKVPLEELSGDLIEMRHQKTGLSLAWVRRKEENKTFGIAFETLPENDTGVFHILEHSVLCGSYRYPVKEPFVELLKNSLNTFLNAMTFPDKTFYPISTRNEKDFMNLSRVYLDAVFHPAIYRNPSIFRQEGWHYTGDLKHPAVDSPESALHYEGVVYNKMRGAFADPDEIMENEINRALFPDTPYAFVSGGDPAKIPDLTYEQFLDYHKRFYAPSNAYVILDGNVPMEEFLKMLDREFLSGFENTGRVPYPHLQKPVDGGIREIPYEVGKEEGISKRYRMAFGRVIGTFRDREKLEAAEVLADVLAGSNQSYLPALILGKGLAEDVSVRIADGVNQPYLKIEVKNMKAEDAEEIKGLIFDELRRLSEEGISRNRLEAALSNEEFALRERDYGTYPEGLLFGIEILESWLYGGKPEQNLEVGDLFKNLRSMMNEGYFEQLIRECILENPHRAEIRLCPSKELGEERREEERKRIQERVSSWSEKDRKEIEAENRDRLKWQEQEDSPEELSKIPHLAIQDLDPEPEHFPEEKSECFGGVLLRHRLTTSGIVYVSVYLPAAGYSEEELSRLSFVSSLLGKVRTRETSSEELQIRIQRTFGNFSANVSVYGKDNQRDAASVYLQVSVSYLKENEEEAVCLLSEILFETEFTEEEEMRNLLKQALERQKQSFIMAGHALGVSRIHAMFTAAGAAQEALQGLAYYRWMKNADRKWSGKIPDAFSPLLRDILSEANPVLSVTADAEYSEKGVLRILEEIESYRREHQMDRTVRFADIQPAGISREGILIPADISFAEAGQYLPDFGSGFSGTMRLSCRIQSLAYLWNQIRVQGGAYGTGMQVRPSGLLAAYSYRDPNGADSIHVYQESGAFLKTFLQGFPDLTGFIIGAVSDQTPLLSPRLK
ncbi:MAG: insulinase family protein, partial [Eubacteriales bacterium]|nr:insulinase family protein [Eubacteriales bacterium]